MTNNLKDTIINHLNKKYSWLIRYETDIWSDYTFFMKDGEVIFGHNKEFRRAYISYEKIWSLLESFFGLESEEIESLIEEWIGTHYKLEVTKSIFCTLGQCMEVVEQYKLETNNK